MSRKRKCLNEACLLNKDLKCDNPLQHQKNFYCQNKNEVKPKNKRYKTNNTLFNCNRSSEFVPGVKKKALNQE